MTTFTPVSAAIGGAMIGLAAVLFMLLNGRIAGISGIVEGVLAPLREDAAWKIAFVAGLFIAPLFYFAATGTAPPIAYPHPVWMIALGGFLVGFGARLGSGCTSGHGVCGMARLSKRSIVATGVFMATAMATVFVTHLIMGGA